MASYLRHKQRSELSQGAKPSHGGILPTAKLTQEIATVRKVPMGKDVLSPITEEYKIDWSHADSDRF